MFFLDAFNPAEYLAKVHKDTTAPQLREGAEAIRARLERKAKDMTRLIEDNFENFVSCKLTVDKIDEEIMKNEIGRSGTGTAQLATLWNGLHFRSSLKIDFFSFFSVDSRSKHDLRTSAGLASSRQPKAKSTWRAAQVPVSIPFARFRFFSIFANCPQGSIKQCRMKGEWDKAAEEYQKAMGLAPVIADKHPLFAKVLDDVNKEAENIRVRPIRVAHSRCPFALRIRVAHACSLTFGE